MRSMQEMMKKSSIVVLLRLNDITFLMSKIICQIKRITLELYFSSKSSQG